MQAYVADSMRKMQLRKSFSDVETYAVGRYCSVETRSGAVTKMKRICWKT